MADPIVIAQRTPYILEMEPGTYYWCRCGRSKAQPFCDGSHTGTDFSPLAIEIKEKNGLLGVAVNIPKKNHSVMELTHD